MKGFLFLAAVLFLCSCNKVDTTTLGGDLIPAIDNINTFEKVYTVFSDNKVFNDTTRALTGEPHALGLIENDVDFGNSSATIYSSFTPTAYRVHPFTTKRDSVIIDSVVLSLGFTELFGDSNAVEQIEVREIGRLATFKDSLYYLNVPDFPVEPALLGSANIDFKTLNDSVFYRNGKDTVRSTNQLRMHLDTAWARRFVEYDTSAGQAYNNDTTFKDRFKGLEIKAGSGSPSKSAFAYFNLGDADRTRITFYCRVKNGGSTDTIAPVFTYTNDPHANIIRRDPSSALLANVTNTTENDDKVYLQPAPGTYATLKIPDLNTLGNVVVHRAELICEQMPTTQDFYAPPKKMFLDVINAANDSSFTIRNDFALTNSFPGYDLNSFGGVYSKSKYIFNLSRYVQSIVTKKFPNEILRLHAPFTTRPYYVQPNTNTVSGRVPLTLVISDPVAYGRVLLYGGASTDPKRMRLRIIYSLI